jgi:hypothetical protein
MFGEVLKLLILNVLRHAGIHLGLIIRTFQLIFLAGIVFFSHSPNSLVWMHAQLCTDEKKNAWLSHNDRNPVLREDMLSVSRILNFSLSGDAEGNCSLVSSLIANALVGGSCSGRFELVDCLVLAFGSSVYPSWGDLMALIVLPNSSWSCTNDDNSHDLIFLHYFSQIWFISCAVIFSQIWFISCAVIFEDIIVIWPQMVTTRI